MDADLEKPPRKKRRPPKPNGSADLERIMRRFVLGSDLTINWEEAECFRLIQEEGWHVDSWMAPSQTQISKDAAAACWTCPIRLQCLEFSCACSEPHGIWGGLPAQMRANVYPKYDYKKLKDKENPYIECETNSNLHFYHSRHFRMWVPEQDD